MFRPKIFPVLCFGVIALSFASILIRLTPAPSIIIATGRMIFSSLILTPIFLKNLPARKTQLKTVNWFLTILSGLFLAAHFALWIESLKHTTVVSSVVLVAMNPIFVSLLAPLFLKERVTWHTWVAVGLGILGALLIAGPTLGSTRITAGNLFALSGALAASGYVLVGRKLRPGLSLVNYIYPVYSLAAITLLIIALLTGQRFTGYPLKAYLFILLLAIGPQLLGHTSFNWALGYLNAPVVAMFILGEPVGTTILAWLLLHQPPTFLELIGGIIICTAIYLATLQTQKQKAKV
ncbi:MAG: DMT family transporter [candidate division WOR-3 bacterium]